MRSLRARLSAAFIGIAILTTILSGVFASYTARHTFRQYLERAEESGASPFGPGPNRPLVLPGQLRERLGLFGAREALFAGRIRNAVWGGTLAAAAIGMLVALWLAGRIVKPVTDLTQATRAITGGSAPPAVPVDGTDEIAELGRAFNRMAARLAADEEQRRRLFAGIAHELRTPLSIIQGSLEGLLDRVIEPTPDRLAALHSETLLLRGLITDLRDLSLAQAGQLRLHRQPVDLTEIVRETVEALAPLSDERTISLRVEAPPHLPPVQADPDRMRQVMQNVVENAIRHTPPGGNVRIGLKRGDNGVRCIVADTGTGISAADLPHIFEHFYRADDSRTRSSGGTGLGLAIVKSLVEAHGGRVSVESTPGVGSRFTIVIPNR